MPRKRTDGPVSTALAWRLGTLGLQVSGDIGPWTVYRQQNGEIKWFLYSPPTKPATDKQLAQRARFTAAQAAWRNLTDAQKQTLEQAVHKASLCLTGQNLYMSAVLTHRETAYQTVARQTNLTLPPLAEI